MWESSQDVRIIDEASVVLQKVSRLHEFHILKCGNFLDSTFHILGFPVALLVFLQRNEVFYLSQGFSFKNRIALDTCTFLFMCVLGGVTYTILYMVFKFAFCHHHFHHVGILSRHSVVVACVNTQSHIPGPSGLVGFSIMKRGISFGSKTNKKNFKKQKTKTKPKKTNFIL